jgi:hypothetical protein
MLLKMNSETKSTVGIKRATLLSPALSSNTGKEASRLFQSQHVANRADGQVAAHLSRSRLLRLGQPRSDKHRIPGRRSISAPVPRPLVPKDREYLRALREAEMTLWGAISNTEAVDEQPVPKPSLGKLFRKLDDPDQKRELFLLLVLAGAALVAIIVGLFQPGSLIERWGEFVQNLR